MSVAGGGRSGEKKPGSDPALAIASCRPTDGVACAVATGGGGGGRGFPFGRLRGARCGR